ncbi:MAG: arylesterase [Hyphomicrobiales bacterium]
MAQNPSLRLVVLGDSLTAGYGLAAGASFPDRLQKALSAKGSNVKVENAGVSGDTSSGALSRLDWAVADGTHMVLVELGANDALRGVAPEETAKALDELITRLKAKGAKVLIAGMVAPPNMGATYGAKFNAIYPDLAKKHEVALYPFFLEGVAALPELNQADGIHPNEKGVDVIVENILPAVEALIASTQKAE